MAGGFWSIESHDAGDRKLLTDYLEFEKPEKVGFGDGRTVEAVGVGNVLANMLFKVREPKRSVLHHVLCVPKLASNLFSVRASAGKGNTVKFGHSKCWI